MGTTMSTVPMLRESAQRQRHVESPAGLAVEAMAQQVLGPLEAVRDGPVGQVEPPGGLAPVAAGVEVRLQRLDELLAHPRVGEERAQLALDDRRGEVRVAQQEPLDAELGDVVDDPVTTDAVRHAEAFL